MKTNIRLLALLCLFTTLVGCKSELSPRDFYNASATQENKNLTVLTTIRQMGMGFEQQPGKEVIERSLVNLDFAAKPFREELEEYQKITPIDQDQQELHNMLLGISKNIEDVLNDLLYPLKENIVSMSMEEITQKMNDLGIAYGKIMDSYDIYNPKLESYQANYSN